MAHKKAGSSKAKQKGNVAGKRLGVKIFGGENVKSGQIIVRQRGSLYRAGEGVGQGKDFTIFAKRDGKVAFSQVTKSKKKISVI
ncbi:hypothetical protein A2716_03335 [candidate division WWE3 bacterium RIFCSPHIGHO2_01_FULL_40_23]|uniref:Large ribosomal subunit protein bL27 n=1 Tax=candidate division WWE3 bacterium RIFCSPLOWO2_01_FULL_41_18 TaxID=1802625 RepID=A0A1F4VDZ2_UNCKA|nr:MAG: hypothetical protein A2716_03335 [candidate division WWE3 bacterium RIFCSPHIGHO2_01_FULL_40_23]OGC54913.1 MAG: hypothetical protein A3A78_02945 [candidate division WWE3 bacterium RIFCSPLOWO2_01_FULL_41_18]